MLRLVLIGALVLMGTCGMLRLPLDIELANKARQHGFLESMPSATLKRWLMDDVTNRDPDMWKHRQMIEHFFDQSINTEKVAIPTLQDTVDTFLRKDFVKKVDAMQEHLIRLYGKDRVNAGVDRSDQEFIDEMKSNPESYFLTYNQYKILKDYKEETLSGEL